jgi:hypothetical protein
MTQKRNRMYLDGLTHRQVEICDMLWSCDTMDEVNFLLNFCLTDEDRRTALTLIEIMHMEAAEADGELELVKHEVDELLNNIMNRA